MSNILSILAAEIAFGKTEIMDGIKEVGFSQSVTPTNARNPFRENEFPAGIIFKLD